MHGDDKTPIWDFTCWVIPTAIVLTAVFMLAVLIGTMAA